MSPPLRLSPSDYRALAAKAREPHNKFHATRVETPEGKFDSQGEATRFYELLILQRHGSISRLERQVHYPLDCGGKPLIIINADTGKPHRSVYVADYVYHDHRIERLVIEDFKGKDTALSRLKRGVLATMLDAEIIVTRTR